MQKLDMNFLQALLRSRAFKEEYCAQKNAFSDNGYKTVGPKRRSVIVSWAKVGGYVGCVRNAGDALEYEKYLNTAWKLDPYGLEESTSITSEASVKYDEYGHASVAKSRVKESTADPVGDAARYLICGLQQPVSNVATKPNFKGNIMANIPTKHLITTITYIAGTPADQIPDETIYQMIVDREATIKHYSAMVNQPARLKVSLTAIQKEIDDLVKLADSRG
jgi:hypothetical protein